MEMLWIWEDVYRFTQITRWCSAKNRDESRPNIRPENIDVDADAGTETSQAVFRDRVVQIAGSVLYISH